MEAAAEHAWTSIKPLHSGMPNSSDLILQCASAGMGLGRMHAEALSMHARAPGSPTQTDPTVVDSHCSLFVQEWGLAA